MVVFFDHENRKLELKNHKFMLAFDRVIVILRKFFNGRRFSVWQPHVPFFNVQTSELFFYDVFAT